MKKIICILFFLNSIFTDAQINLVPNYSFEDTLSCSYLSTGLLGADWYAGSGSPDYFNQTMATCQFANNGFSNVFGYQAALEGNSYVGFSTYCSACGLNYEEWFQAHLINSLIANKKYCVSFYINLAHNCKYASDDIGAYLSDTAIVYNGPPFIEFPSQINNPQGNFITDTVNWTLISGIMTAQGGEKYITIGNFKNDAHTTVVINDANNPNLFSYYFTDVVSVIQLPDVNAGISDTICKGGSTELNGSCTGCWAGLQYRWYPSAGLSDTTVLHPMAQPTQTTTYYFGLIDTTGTVICMADNVDSVTVYVGCSGVNEEKITDFKFQIYPNPTNSNLNIECNLQKETFIITDILGKEIKEIKTESKKTSMDISEWENGIYFIRNKNSTKKFVVLR